jgi:hypothetical protein
MHQINQICTLRSADAGGRDLRQIGGTARVTAQSSGYPL